LERSPAPTKAKQLPGQDVLDQQPQREADGPRDHQPTGFPLADGFGRHPELASEFDRAGLSEPAPAKPGIVGDFDALWRAPRQITPSLSLSGFPF
jgi:hypothetical protein